VMACCLATATGLALDSQRLHARAMHTGPTTAAPRSCDNGTAFATKPVTRAALCLAGNARTFPESDVISNLETFLQDLQADKSCTTPKVDLFAYMTLTGDRDKDQPGMNSSQINASRQAVEGALEMLNATTFEAVDEAGEVTVENIGEYVVGLQCFKGGYWGNIKRLVRSVNQLRHVQGCLQQVIQHEARTGEAYDVVMISRPDFIYSDNAEWSTFIWNISVTGQMRHKKDWFLALPRPVVDAFFDPKRSMPLTCHPGDACCHHVQRSEDMFEYIVDAPLMSVCNSTGPCYTLHQMSVSNRSLWVNAGGIAFKNRRLWQPRRKSLPIRSARRRRSPRTNQTSGPAGSETSSSLGNQTGNQSSTVKLRPSRRSRRGSPRTNRTRRSPAGSQTGGPATGNQTGNQSGTVEHGSSVRSRRRSRRTNRTRGPAGNQMSSPAGNQTGNQSSAVEHGSNARSRRRSPRTIRTRSPAGIRTSSPVDSQTSSPTGNQSGTP